MAKLTKPLSIFLCCAVLFFGTVFSSPVYGQLATSNAACTKIGNPIGQPIPPPGCQTGQIKVCNSPADYDILAQEVLNNPNLVLAGDANLERSDIKNHNVECNLVALLDSLLTLNVKIIITALNSDHANDGGFHPRGMAVDLGYFSPTTRGDTPEGLKVYDFLYTKRVELKVIQIIWGYPPDDSSKNGKLCIGQSNNSGDAGTIGNPVNCDAFYTVGTMSQHANHIHTAIHL